MYNTELHSPFELVIRHNQHSEEDEGDELSQDEMNGGLSVCNDLRRRQSLEQLIEAEKAAAGEGQEDGAPRQTGQARGGEHMDRAVCARADT